MTNESNIGFLTGFLHAQLITIVFSFVDLSMLITNYLSRYLSLFSPSDNHHSGQLSNVITLCGIQDIGPKV